MMFSKSQFLNSLYQELKLEVYDELMDVIDRDIHTLKFCLRKKDAERMPQYKDYPEMLVYYTKAKEILETIIEKQQEIAKEAKEAAANE